MHISFIFYFILYNIFFVILHEIYFISFSIHKIVIEKVKWTQVNDCTRSFSYDYFAPITLLEILSSASSSLLKVIRCPKYHFFNSSRRCPSGVYIIVIII